MNSKTIEQQLYNIANLQQGYFTAHQAKKAGYSDSRFAYHVKKGNWVKEGRGIYRLANYPLGERPDLVYWSLWSCSRQGKIQGVFSHETALAIHELSDVMPAKYHMTVPKRFRKYHSPPDNLILYFSNLESEEIWEFNGYKVTSPLRTIHDILLDEGFPEELVIQAIFDGLNQGIFTAEQIINLKEKLQSERIISILEAIEKSDK